MRSSQIAIPLAALALAAAAPVAHADRDLEAAHRNEVSFGGAAHALRSSSANALTAANLAGISLGIARDLGMSPLPGLTLWAEAGLVTGSASGAMFQSLATAIDELGLTAGLAARYRLNRRITAGARVALGAQHAHIAIRDAQTSASDHGWGAMTSAGAAFDLLVVARPHFGLIIRFEASYVAAKEIALTLRANRPGDAIPLKMTEFSFGHLDLSGPSAAVSLLGQF
jgi:hypothetical protein